MKNEEIKKEDLYILGNGFDLFLGLPTKYTDFINNEEVVNEKERLMKELQTIENEEELSKKIKESKYHNNAFIFYLYYKEYLEDKLWCDVEKQIIPYHEFIKTINGFSYDQRFGYEFDSLRKIIEFINLIVYKTEDNNFIYEDIKRFELAFSEYIDTIDFFKSDYAISTLSMNDPTVIKMSNIFEIKNLEDYKYKTTINFNYTKYITGANRFKNAHNVHGKAMGSKNKENIPIFGIDINELEGLYSKELYKFTKTYKSMIRNINVNQNGLLVKSENLEKIVFFGHSLSSADYSYFQSIFDYYELYSSDVILEFLYYVYDENKRNEISNDRWDSVYKLIEKYGKTLDNKDKGKNLLHKLLIESRLKIVEINEYGKRKKMC